MHYGYFTIRQRKYRACYHHAVDSRTEDNRQIGLSLMQEAGVTITSTETIIFQILKKAGTAEFKALLKTIK